MARERRTRRIQLAEQTVDATEDDPYGIVESSSTGTRAVHEASSLRRS